MNDKAGSFNGPIEIKNRDNREVSLEGPGDIYEEVTHHIICEVCDHGTPPLTR
ncbi:MAG: hypothetical protein JXR41_08050 [Bacteroidales bacterium]|nr:hypothetical protein [Bacteroidales bacterium]